MSAEPETAALVLAAGSSRRFGEQKLLAPLRGRPLVRWAVESALGSNVDRVLVVAGEEGSAVRDALEDLPAAVVLNPDPEEGMASSIRVGVVALPDGVEWVVILLGDQPEVTPELVNRVLEARDSGRPMVAPVYQGRQGNPVAFHSSVFSELEALTGDEGARPLLKRDPGRVTRLELDLPMPRDVDTREDLLRLRTKD